MSSTKKDTFALFNHFANDAAAHCAHISVREDEHGWYVFALGLKETHTLQIRCVDSLFTVQCWYGRTAEDEFIFDEPIFEQPEHAFAAAIEWLKKDLA